MKSTSKQGTKARNGRVVKHQNFKRVAISFALATVGVIAYALLYQYTYQAKLEKSYNTVQTELDKKNQTLLQSSNDKEQLQKQIEELNQQKQQLENQLQAKAEAKKAIAQSVNMSFSGDKATWMTAAGINPSDWGYVDYIISHESGWRPDARNSIGCLGLAQACPGQKILNVCPDLDPVCQLRWASSYANRYGGWAGSYSEWISKRWW